ncbi:MAG: hypothetical protein ACRC2T_03145 [Thermoguttaceae bacterium]
MNTIEVCLRFLIQKEKKIMKKPVLAFLYVFSIVAAVGIASFAVGGGEGKVGRQATELPLCTFYEIPDKCSGPFGCSSLPVVKQGTDFVHEGYPKKKDSIVTEKIAGPQSTYQCYLQGVNCDLVQSFKYASAPNGCIRN